MTKPKNKRKPRRDDVRGDLLQAALALLDKDGPARLSVRAVARRADIAFSAAARCFPSRNALLTEMATQALIDLLAVIEVAAAAPAAPCGEQVLAVGAEAFAYAKRAPHRYALCWRFDEIDASDPRWLAAGEALTKRLAQLLRPHGVVPQPSLAVTGSMLHGFVELRKSGAIDHNHCLFMQRKLSTTPIIDAAPAPTAPASLSRAL